MTGRRANATGRLTAFTVAGVVLWRFAFWLLWLRHLDKVGDEGFYLRRTVFIERLLTGQGTVEGALAGVRDRGWFMPGVPIHAAPARILFTEGDVDLQEMGWIRLWMGTIDLLLLAAVALLVARLFGRRIGLAFFVVVGLFPETSYASFQLLGEAHASKLLLIALLLITAIIKNEPISSPRALAIGVGAGVILGWSIYLRPPMLLQIGTLVLALVVVAGGMRVRPSGRVVAAASAAAITALVILAPWSRHLSTEFGSVVLTTVSVDVNLIHAFAVPEDIAAMTGGTGFNDIHNHAIERSEASGDGYAATLREMREELWENVSVRQYVTSVNREVGTFLGVEFSVLGDGHRIDTHPESTAIGNIGLQFDVLNAINRVFWYSVAFVAIFGMFRRYPVTAQAGFLALTGKVALVALTVQPWISNAKFRHFGATLPLLVLFASLIVAWEGPRLLRLFPHPTEPRPFVEQRQNWTAWAHHVSTQIQVTAGLWTAVTLAVYLT